MQKMPLNLKISVISIFGQFKECWIKKKKMERIQNKKELPVKKKMVSTKHFQFFEEPINVDLSKEKQFHNSNGVFTHILNCKTFASASIHAQNNN